jgi:hypothetical protein
MRKIILIVLGTLSLAACTFGASTTQVTPLPTEIYLDTQSSMIQPLTITVGPTKIVTTAQTPTLTPSPLPETPTSTPTMITQPPMIFTCLDISPTLPDTTTLTGTVLLGLSANATSPPLLIDMETGSQTESQELEGCGFFLQSPDSTWIAYKDYKTLHLVLIAADGIPREVVPWDENWRGMAGWLDNEKLVIVLEGERNWQTMPSQGIYNAFTGEYQEINRDYPYIDYLADTDYLWSTSTIYDPTLTRVVYTANSERGKKLVLWDLNANQEIAQLEHWEYTTEPAKWSPDGQRFITAHAVLEQGSSEWHQEFFSITNYGQIDQLTHFTNYFENPVIGTFTWSPNGQYVAFWFEDKLKDDYETLAVLDIVTKKVVNYCIPGNQHSSLTLPPVWSPNSEQILIKNTLEDGNHSRVILVDIVQGYAAQIAENMKPIGWLKTTP